MTNQYGDLPTGWEQDILNGINAPITAANVEFLDAWNQVEHGPGGGGPNPIDAFNPFNTTQPEGTAPSTNSAGVKTYPDWATGLQATITTLGYGAYSGLRGLLQSGTATPQQLGSSPDLSTWGTGQFNPANYQTTPSGPAASGSHWWDAITDPVGNALGAVGHAVDTVIPSDPNVVHAIENPAAATSDANILSLLAGSSLAGIGAGLRKWSLIILLSVAAVLLMVELFRQEAT